MFISPQNVLDVTDRAQFRAWLAANHDRPASDGALYYLDAVEEALCFGWIDSTQAPVDGVRMQRFSPRRPGRPWSELNKERARRLLRLGLMTDAGRAVLPPMGPRSFHLDPDVVRALKDARCYSAFKRFPPLYQRVRAYNVAFYKRRNPDAYHRALQNLIDHTKRGELYGPWNDYGRLG